MSKIAEITKTRTCFDKVSHSEEEYRVFVTSNGEEFFNKTSAKKYQDKIDRSQTFSDKFTSSKGNLKKGSLLLAKRLAGNSNISDNQIIDYFWVKPQDTAEFTFLKSFISKHYSIGATGCSFIEFSLNKWTFISVKKKDCPGDNNKVYYCEVEAITKEIDTLKSLVPSFGVEDVEDVEDEDEDDSRFDILDLSGDK